MSKSDSYRTRNSPEVSDDWPQKPVPRELKHDHVWSRDTCFAHGCPDCCGCAAVPWLCASCYEDGFFTWKEEAVEERARRLEEWQGLASRTEVDESLKEKELVDMEGEKEWLEVAKKEISNEWEEVENDSAGANTGSRK